MSTTLDKMTAAELVQKAFDIDTYLDSILCRDEETYSELCLIRAELDRRCTNAGIFQNPDGTYRMPPFKGSVDEMAERLALLGYLIAKGGGK